MSRNDDSYPCPHCGADLSVRESFCRECGASDDSGWDDSESGSDEIAGYADEDEFDYDDFVRREFGVRTRPAKENRWKQWLIGLVVALVCLGLVLFSVAA